MGAHTQLMIQFRDDFCTSGSATASPSAKPNNMLQIKMIHIYIALMEHTTINHYVLSRKQWVVKNFNTISLIFDICHKTHQHVIINLSFVFMAITQYKMSSIL